MSLKNISEDKPLLAIETSGELCSATLYYSNKKYFSAGVNLKHAHSEKLFEIIDFIFNTVAIGKKDISGVAVSGGPGSFTGLRIGMAAAKGIAYGANVPMLVVPTFEAFAFQLSFYLSEGSQFVIANRVNKDEVYYAKFQISTNSYIFVDELTILSNDDFISKAGGLKIFGNAKKLLTGREQNHQLPVMNVPMAEVVAMWANKFGKEKFTNDYNLVEPIYLKEFLIKEKK